jgi:hypothetical protein
MNNPTDWFQQKGVEDIKASVPEKMISDILTKYEIEHYPEVSFKGLKYSTGYYARFDIWIPSIAVLIEYDGQQYHQDEAAVRKDALKDKFCQQYQINLIRYNKLHYYKLDTIIYQMLCTAQPTTVEYIRVVSKAKVYCKKEKPDPNRVRKNNVKKTPEQRKADRRKRKQESTERARKKYQDGFKRGSRPKRLYCSSKQEWQELMAIWREYKEKGIDKRK